MVKKEVKKMRKDELLDLISKGSGATKKQANDMLAALTDTIVSTLKKDGAVAIPGFGTFHRTYRKAGESINPRDPSGPKVKVSARNVPKFTAGKVLKEAVR